MITTEEEYVAFCESHKNANKKALAAKKHCLLLLDGDKFKRKRGFVELRNYLSAEELTGQDLRDVFNETQMYTLNGLRDKTELIREEAIKFFTFFLIDKLPLNDYYLTYVFPVLVERIGTVELVEESEEIRLQLVKFLQAIILKYSNSEQLKPFLNDVVVILCEMVKDKYPEIKVLSCRIVTDLAGALPRDFHQQSLNLVKPVITAFRHQRSKVRLAAVRCMGDIVMHSDYKAIEEVVQPMAERLFDGNSEVRVAVSQVTARWLTEYRDRYSFFPKLLPLILTGLNDEVPATREIARQLWSVVGLQYMKENENDLKDQMDFLTEEPKYYPSYLKRPNLGCRVLVQRNVSKIAPALMRELSSWQEDITMRCSQLLCSIALHAEAGITQHLKDILQAMSTAVRDDQKITVANILRAGELIGLFVPPDSWLKLILPAIENTPHEGNILILSSLVKGCPQEYIFCHLEEIAKTLAEHHICQTRKKKLQRSLVSCVRAINEKYKNPLSQSQAGKHLFTVSVTLIALDCEDKGVLLQELRESLGYNENYPMWHEYLPDLLKQLAKDPKSWLVLTTERCIFQIVLQNSGEAFGENLDAIADILVKTLDMEVDAESRLMTFTALSDAFDAKDVAFKNSDSLALNSFLERLVVDVFIPTLVWHAGRTAESMRTIAALCMCSALTPTEKTDLFTSAEVYRPIFDNVLPLLLSLAEDASSLSRQFALKDLSLLKKLACKNKCWNLEDLLKIYPEILKRLDDPTDSVRLLAVAALAEIMDETPEDFKRETYKFHHELLIDTLLIHFTDDNDKTLQELVLGVLKVMAQINGDLFVEKVGKRKSYLEKVEGCSGVIEYLKELSVQ